MTTYPVGSYFMTPVTSRVGWLIAVGQLLAGRPSAYSHGGVIVTADGDTIEGQPGGARRGHMDSWPDALVCDGPILGLPLEQQPIGRVRVANAARLRQGTGYSWLDYVALGMLHLHLPAAGWVRHRVETSKRAICSQLVTLIYADAGICLFPDPKHLPGDTMPADLAAWADAWETRRVEATA